MADIIKLTVTADGVAVVRMEDTAGKNTFSPAFTGALLATFQAIADNQAVKVVVLTGYDRYFCAGGSKQELLEIVTGRMTFDSLGFYRLLLDCPVPAIAAMQGHAIGGGLAMGCFADAILLAEESLYSANFMNYGFTPGMGATCILPLKFGPLLASEMLLSGRSYQGEELQRRGVGARVVRRAQVMTEALGLAQELADKPRQSLVLLKRELTRRLRAELPAAIEQELAMHAVTMADASVRQKVEALYGT